MRIMALWPLVLIALGILAVETIVAYQALPDTDRIAAQVRQEIRVSLREEEELAVEESELIEQSMGVFKGLITPENEPVTLAFSLEVHFLVPSDRVARYDNLASRKEHRLRDRIVTILRSANIDDFKTPGLPEVKKRIVESCNNVLGKPFIQDVVFSEFQTDTRKRFLD